MIETLESKAASLDREDFATADLAITGITFEGGDLSKPRYGSLIDYVRAPAGVQFEPGLQLREPIATLTVRFEIDPAAGVRFVANDQEVLVSSILDPQSFSPPGLVSATLVGGDPRKCDLIWKQSEADAEGVGKLNTLRLHCELEQPRSLSSQEQVEGGLYLAILNREEALYELPFSKEPDGHVDGTIRMLGFDTIGRPMYDLYLQDPQNELPQALVLEPAFRCREGQIVTFSLALDLPPEIDLKFVIDAPPNDDQVAVDGFLPHGHPFQLYQTTVGAFDDKENRKSTITWTQETGRQYCATSNPGEAKRCYCIQGQSSGFGLRAAPNGQGVQDRRKMASIDPTVIQPPSCTAGGICITP
jgi:hypothetical protein